MNYFAHAFRFLDNPYFLAGTSLPDWLSVVNRRARLRKPQLIAHLDSPDERVRQLVGGMIQHLEDDMRFHNSTAFSEVLVQVVRTIYPVVNPQGAPLTFLSHLLVEILLDAVLLQQLPNAAAKYYASLDQVDSMWIEATASAILGQQVDHLGAFIQLFCKERILDDYNDDEMTFTRMNQVMARLKLPALPKSLQLILPRLREIVAARENDFRRALDA
ncbi:MAG: hypothetical protein ACUVTH_04240 [Thermogutta sp.]